VGLGEDAALRLTARIIRSSASLWARLASPARLDAHRPDDELAVRFISAISG
jgi:hypothetical protein